jgi:hypothetical protein
MYIKVKNHDPFDIFHTQQQPLKNAMCITPSLVSILTLNADLLHIQKQYE